MTAVGNAARGDRAIQAGLVVSLSVVTLVAVVISYGHLYALARDNGEDGTAAAVLPITVDGLILACSLVIVKAARSWSRQPVLAWLMLSAGIAATLAGNVAHGIEHGWPGALVAGWPAAVAAGCFHLVIGEMRRGRVAEPDTVPEADEGPVWWPLPKTGAAGQDGGGEALSERLEPLGGPAATGALGAASLPALEPPAALDEPPGDALEDGRGDETDPDLAPVIADARDRFAEMLEAGQLPSVRKIRRELRVGHPRAVGVRTALANGHRPAGVEGH